MFVPDAISTRFPLPGFAPDTELTNMKSKLVAVGPIRVLKDKIKFRTFEHQDNPASGGSWD